ncbi:DUF6325 family protein [Microbacterium sp.]|uniref:DUF6325 family protein n=1 Tax=Microbacterium sp. TaxID=51671 RepID=UPI0039E5E079
MAQFTFGPVEFYLVALADSQPSQAVLQALGDQLDAGVLRLLDFVVITKSDAGDVTATEVDSDLELAAPGLAGDEDLDEFAAYLAPGTSAAVVALELTWATAVSEKLAASGAEVLSVERIPASVVNGLVDAVGEDD